MPVEVPRTWSQMATNVVASKYYRGTLGTWYSHTLYNCHYTTPAITCAAGICTAAGTTSSGATSRYFLITASGPGGEGNAGGAGWSGPNHTSAPAYTVPAACGGN